MQDFGRKLDFQITRVWAKNFRSVADVSFEMDPLTGLVGPNASGKSNLLDVLRFIKDALSFDLEVAISFRNGMEGVARRESGVGDCEIEMGVGAIVSDLLAEDGYYSIEYGFTLARVRNGGYRVHKEYVKAREMRNPTAIEFIVEEGVLTTSSFSFFSEASSIGDDIDFGTSDLALSNLLRIPKAAVVSVDADDTYRATLLMYDGLRLLRRNLTGMRFYHVFPNTVREPQRSSNAFILEEDASNLASIIRELDEDRSDSKVRLRDALGLLVPEVSDIRVVPAGGYLVVELRHDDIAGGAWLDLSMESDGTVRILALLVAMYQTLPPPVIGIEEPELTVHPGALEVLAELLNEAAWSSQIVVTTHSPEFIDYLTEYKAVESLRIVELEDGATTVHRVGETQVNAVKKNLFSPGELHRIGELTASDRFV